MSPAPYHQEHSVALVSRPSPEVVSAIRTACQRLLAIEAQFLTSFHAALIELVPSIGSLGGDGGRAITDGLARSVLWAALTEDPPEVVEATFAGVGADYRRAGFPAEGYHCAGHALLRSAKDVYTGDWSSELSSGWVAFYSWLSPHLERLADPHPPGGPTGGPDVHAVNADGYTDSPDGHAGSPEPHLPGPGVYGDQHAAAGAPRSGGQHAEPAGPYGERAANPPQSTPRGLPVKPNADTPRRPVRGSAGFDAAGLDAVLEALRARYFSGNERALDAVLIRVTRRTGADLRDLRPDQQANPFLLADVLATLQEMGYILPPDSAPPGPDEAREPGGPRNWPGPQTSATQREAGGSGDLPGGGRLPIGPGPQLTQDPQPGDHAPSTPGRGWRRAVPSLFR